MATANIVNGDQTVNGTLTASQLSGPLNSSNLSQDASIAFPIPLTGFRIWDAFQTVLPGTSSGDDIGIATGTWGSALPHLVTATTGAPTTYYARTFVQLPPRYVAGASAVLRFAAGMGTAAAGACTLDCEAYLSARDTLVSGSDLVTTAATSINSLTFANTDFVLTATNLVAGSWLDVRIAIALTAGSSGYGRIAHAELLCTIKG